MKSSSQKFTSPIETSPSREEFVQLAATSNLIAVSTTIVGDVQTPVSAFARIVGDQPGYLLESAEITDVVGHYSFVGADPFLTFSKNGDALHIAHNGQEYGETCPGDPLVVLKEILSRHHPAPGTATTAAAVGFLGYDAIRHFEPTVGAPPPDDLHSPECVFMACRVILIFDHKTRRLRIVVHGETNGTDPGGVYDRCVARIREVLAALQEPVPLRPLNIPQGPDKPAQSPKSNTSREEFLDMVQRAKEHIRAGDIFQVVLSQRFEAPFGGTPLDLYRALRFVNPSPYLFCLQMPGGVALVGSSPEVHVRLQDGQVDVRPIAGTRPRGASLAEDEANAADLLADPKERAEHVMLVDLGRNDIGRIANYSSVHVNDFMTIERYSHVMHIVSNVRGLLRGDRDSFDVLRATFPAGTVSGSPKVRAMQLINAFEKNKRGTYAGVVAFFRLDGNLDSCITLRSVLLRDGVAYVQAGAGIVADSIPENEYDETVNKARGMMRAIALATELTSTGA